MQKFKISIKRIFDLKNNFKDKDKNIISKIIKFMHFQLGQWIAKIFQDFHFVV